MRLFGRLLLGVALVATPAILANQNPDENSPAHKDHYNLEPPSNPAGPPDIPPRELNRVSLDPRNWYFFYHSRMPAHPSFDREGAGSFEFPSAENGGYVSYLQTPYWATTTPSRMTITFKVESDDPGNDVIDPTDHPPATFHLFFEQRNDDLVDPNGRWWADESAFIYNFGSQDAQTLTDTVPLTPDVWGNVNGQFNAQAFSTALANVGWVGITFGGQFFAGHGVAMSSGHAKYILIDFHVD